MIIDWHTCIGYAVGIVKKLRLFDGGISEDVGDSGNLGLLRLLPPMLLGNPPDGRASVALPLISTLEVFPGLLGIFLVMFLMLPGPPLPQPQSLCAPIGLE